ncbi:MAG: BatA domain-containing protein [Gemmataceae bacterium]|nr:BatA domain-containing protein [Gemmataceae bacterium]MDW8264302.1 BatA domain-containing protein [Gemmataceae bacterium]
MSVIHPLLLGGLVLVGLPVLLHLIMRQKPKHLLFPAFRFLLARHRTNRRKLRLRHLVLLLLRMLLIAAFCLALARPTVFSEELHLTANQPVWAALVFDTSPSMDYVVGDRTRLEEAKRRAEELLETLPEGSRFVVLDTADSGSDPWLPRVEALERVRNLKVRPSNAPITTRLGEAYRLLASVDEATSDPAQVGPRLLYVFSDRAQDCWDAARVPTLRQQRDRLAPLRIVSMFADVGVDQPVDLAITAVEPARTAVPSNAPVVVRVTVRATGNDCDSEVTCRFDGEKTVERKAVQLKAGQSQVISFTRPALPPGYHQAEIALATPDNLGFNNVGFATVVVRGTRRVLTVTDTPDDVQIWTLTLQSGEPAFRNEVRAPQAAANLSPGDLSAYAVVAIVNVRRLEWATLWQSVYPYVAGGGGLAIVPAADLDPQTFRGLLDKVIPGDFVKVVAAGADGARWNDARFQPPLRTWFQEWSRNPNVGFLKFPPVAFRYWEVQPLVGKASVWAAYQADGNPPALLETLFDRREVRGRVVLFTVPLDDRASAGDDRWHDYLAPPVPFYVALVKKSVGYLAGDSEEPTLNWQCGQVASVPLPVAPRFPTYLLQGPGVSQSDAVVSTVDKQSEIHLTQVAMPGNYQLIGGERKWWAAFSLNTPAGESLLEKVPVEQIEALFGPNSVVSLGHMVRWSDALREHQGQPLELLPALMVLVLLVLALENLLANKFYGRDDRAEAPSPVAA